VILLVGAWTLDRFTLRALPSPGRWLKRWLRIGKLKRELVMNPHDRRARLELGELLLSWGRYTAAVEVLRPNLEAGDEDSATLMAMGTACLGAGHHEQGEKLLAHLSEADPQFRLGEIDLLLGRWRLKRGNFRGAREALERFCKQRRGTVEGRVLLAKALEGESRDADAALIREEAWKEYVTAPRFQRRIERPWAWRAKPSRPLAYAVVALVVGGLFARYAMPTIQDAAAQYRNQNPYGYGYVPPDDPGDPDQGP
jgi:hypothetical protein